MNFFNIGNIVSVCLIDADKLCVKHGGQYYPYCSAFMLDSPFRQIGLALVKSDDSLVNVSGSDIKSFDFFIKGDLPKELSVAGDAPTAKVEEKSSGGGKLFYFSMPLQDSITSAADWTNCLGNASDVSVGCKHLLLGVAGDCDMFRILVPCFSESAFQIKHDIAAGKVTRSITVINQVGYHLVK